MKRLLLAAVLFLLSEISFAKEKLNYTVTSDSQIQNVKGNFEAIGNVLFEWHQLYQTDYLYLVS